MVGIISENEWIKTPLGSNVLKHELALFDSAVVDLFGFNAVQLGFSDVNFLRQCRIPNLFSSAVDSGTLHCNFNQLPFASSSLDLLLMPHVLEFSENPHQVLRDAERTLVPEGHLLISGFNPMSLWGIRHGLCKKVNYPWRGKFISLMRIKDWLALLGLEVVAGHMACYIPPCQNGNWLERINWMDKAGDRWWPMMGGIYFLVARKRVVGMRLIRPQWGKRRIAQTLIPRPKPTQRKCQQKAELVLTVK